MIWRTLSILTVDYISTTCVGLIVYTNVLSVISSMWNCRWLIFLWDIVLLIPWGYLVVWFIRYIYYWNLQFIYNVIINKTWVLLPQTSVTLGLLPQTSVTLVLLPQTSVTLVLLPQTSVTFADFGYPGGFLPTKTLNYVPFHYFDL